MSEPEYVAALERLAKRYEQYAECEPDWVEAEKFRIIAASVRREIGYARSGD